MYFACCAEPTPVDDVALYILHPTRLNTLEMATPGLEHPVIPIWERPASLLFEAPFLTQTPVGRESERILAVRPIEFDPRMKAQSTRFTIHGRPIPLDEHPERETFLTRVTIPSGAIGLLRSQLAGVDVSDATVFPDLEHIALELSRLSRSRGADGTF
jgi:hypothetical protein